MRFSRSKAQKWDFASDTTGELTALPEPRSWIN